MSGHNRWSKIKHAKAASDAKKSKGWTKLLKEVTVAAKGGGDPSGNPRLRTAVDKARASNVPNDTIKRSIQKGTGELAAETFEDLLYEVYGPGGTAVVVEILTDNRNRTAGEIRHAFARNGGNLGEAGCVGWMFHRRGYFAIARDAMDEEKFMDLALELGADDVAIEEDVYEVYTSMEGFISVQEELERRGIPLAAGELAMVPQTTIDVPRDKVSQVLRLVESLEDLDDVQKVWANLNIDDKVLEEQSR
jgi:YebC/PmpR family DNA-binding regulatory protein